MANITVSASNPVVSVASTLSNVAVSDVDSGQLVTTISTSQSNVSVSSTSTEVTVGGLAAVSNAVIRSAVSAQDLGGDGSFSYNPTTGVFTYTGPDPLEVRAHFSNTSPITYNSSQGIFGIDSGALFSGKTTDDLPEGNNNIYFSKTGAAVNTNNLPQGSLNKYFTTTGAAVNTDNLAEGTTNFFFTNSRFDTRFATKTTSNLTEGSNLYFTNTRARNAVSFIPGSGAYTPATGVFQIPTNTSHVLENTNLYYTNARVLAYIIDNGLDFNAEKVDDQVANLLVAGNSIDITYNDSANTLTIDYQEDVVSNGNIFGNVSFDLDSGTIHKASLISNITGMSFANITAGDSATLIFTQDLTGYRIIDTTTYPANWTNWDFTDNSTELSLDPSAVDVMSVVYDGSTYYASIVSMEDSAIPNSNLSNSNVIINGTTFTLGTSGTLNTFNTDVVINGNLEVAGNIDYVNVEDLLVNDQSITLNYGNASARDAFVYVDRSGSALNNAHIKWNETSDQWEIYDGTSTYKIPVSTDDLAEGSTNKYYATSLFNTDFATKTTDDLTEGSNNLYFSNTNLATSSTTHLPEGTNLYYTDARVDTHLNTGTATTGEVLSWTGSDYDWVAQTGGTSYSNANVADYLLDTGIQKKAHTVFVQDLALSPDAANAQLGFYFPNGSGSAGQVLKFDSATQLTQATLDTGNVTETTNLFYTDARVQSNTAADTGLVHTTGTETVGGAKSFTSAMTVTPSVTVGGDITNAEIGIKEFHTPSAGSLMGGGGLLRTTYGRGTEASPVYGKDGDLTFRFIGVGYREGPVATTGGIFGFQQDGGNVSGAVPMAAVFRNATQYTGFSHTGVDNNGKSDVYLTEAFASKQNKAHVTDTLIIGNHDPKQATPATANLTIGHTDVDETEGRSIYLWYAAGSGIQSYAGAFDITSTGVPPINSDTVCIGMNAMPRHKAGTIDSGSDTTTFAGDTWIGDYLADGTAVTINGSPTSNAANADGQTYYTKALAEFDFAYAPSRTGLVTYALYTDSALTTPLVWGSGGLNAPGTPSADGNDYSGWADIQFTSGDFTKKIPTAQTTTTGSGTGAEFFVSKKGTSYTGVGSYTSHLTKYNRVGFGAEPMAKGSGYAVTDTVEIDGSYLGGVSGTHNLTFTIDSVDGGGGVTSVGNISGTAYDPATSTWSFEKQYTSDNLSIKHNGTEKLSLTTTQTEFLSIPILPQYSNTSLPAASNPGGMIFVTNGNDKPAYSNGSAWLYVFDNSAVT